jgi:leucyl aminopeptidase
VLGILHACASLRLPCNVVGVIAAAENAISANAYRPGDIVRMANGKCVEITNTDAEGRMILGDALWYAQEHLNPTRMIDFATLTGGVVVALGNQCAGLMTTDDELAESLEECGRATHERVWRLPLWDEYFDLIKGGDADFRNSSNKRSAHPIVGGIFLKQFVKDGLPWAHLDIAGTAYDEDSQPMTGKGATGFGVRLMVEFLRRHAS